MSRFEMKLPDVADGVAEVPIERFAGWDTTDAHAQEWSCFSGPDRVGQAMERVMSA